MATDLHDVLDQASGGSVGHRITGRYPGAVNRHHGIGWEFVHVCIDDASRVAFVRILADQRKESAVAFLEAAVAYYAKLGITIERVMTDNASCYRSQAFRAASPAATPTSGPAEDRNRPYSARPGRTSGGDRKAQVLVRAVVSVRASRGLSTPDNCPIR